MGFWDNAVGNPAPAPGPAPVAAPAPAQPVQQGPWWQQGLYNGQPAVPAAPAAQEAVPGQPNPGEWGTVEGSTRRAKSARLDKRCPDCGSTNYFKPDGMPNAMEQCYECGSNPRFSQMTQGGGLPGGDAAGPATPARQIAGAGLGGVSNFHPQEVIGRVG